MKSPITGSFQKPNADLRARYAYNTSLILIVTFLAGIGFTLYLAQTTKIWQLYIISAVFTIASILGILAIRFSIQKRVESAAILMISGIIFSVLPLTLTLSGVGLSLGMAGFIAVFIIAGLTLTQPQYTWAASSGIILGISTILLDIFYPIDRPEISSLTTLLSVTAVITIAIFSYYLSQQFANYPLRNKLILLFIMVVFFSVGSVAIVTNILIRNEVTKQVGQSQQALAERLAFETGEDLESQVENLLASGIQFKEITEAANKRYTGSDQENVNQILKLDQEWINAPDQSTLISEVIENETADKLREFQELFPNHVELFLTDKYGANIAATNRTSDYYQADEDWWKVTYNMGEGKIFIDQPEFDESSQTYAVNIAIPLYANEQVAGILRSTYDVTAIFSILRQGALGGTKETELRLSQDNLLTGETIASEELSGLDTVMGNFGEINYKGKPSLVSQKRVFSSEFGKARQAILQLGWSVIVHEDLDVALSPIRQQTRTISLIAVAITALAGLFGIFASQRLAAPILALTDVTRKVTEGDLSIQAQISTRDEIGELAISFNQMTSQLRETLGGLERRIAERTADVELARLLSEQRAQELQSISEISRAISTEQRLEILLPLISRLVSERFGFYHVGIFFVDETRKFAFLQAANSEGGQKMLSRGHRLEIGKGLVGTVAQTGQPRIALDVGSDASFFDNPDLPETRSEMALPLNIRGQTIGILDVQSTKPAAFSEGDANTLGILGDQVAIAIENARLFGQTQQARDEAEALYSQVLRQEWNSFNQQTSNIGYRQTSTGGKSIKRPVETDEIRQSLESGQVVAIDGNGKSSMPTIAIPVKLRGQTLGVLNIKAPTKDRKWNRDEIYLAQAISDRLALALDNARLLQESQRRAAKEAKIGEVSAKISASINMRNVLETAVEELGRALPGSEVLIQFEQESGKS